MYVNFGVSTSEYSTVYLAYTAIYIWRRWFRKGMHAASVWNSLIHPIYFSFIACQSQKICSFFEELPTDARWTFKITCLFFNLNQYANKSAVYGLLLHQSLFRQKVFMNDFKQYINIFSYVSNDFMHKFQIWAFWEFVGALWMEMAKLT